jgi:hypothetical protein
MGAIACRMLVILPDASGSGYRRSSCFPAGILMGTAISEGGLKIGRSSSKVKRNSLKTLIRGVSHRVVLLPCLPGNVSCSMLATVSPTRMLDSGLFDRFCTYSSRRCSLSLFGMRSVAFSPIGSGLLR